jgi:hypothetical protein
MNLWVPKILGSFWAVEWLVTSQEGLGFLELVNSLVSIPIFYKYLQLTKSVSPTYSEAPIPSSCYRTSHESHESHECNIQMWYCKFSHKPKQGRDSKMAWTQIKARLQNCQNIDHQSHLDLWLQLTTRESPWVQTTCPDCLHLYSLMVFSFLPDEISVDDLFWKVATPTSCKTMASECLKSLLRIPYNIESFPSRYDTFW